jgi:hypothetical protein
MTTSDSLQIDLAEDPNTDPEVLSDLVFRAVGIGVLQAIAQNPSTPTETVIELSRHHHFDVRFGAMLNSKLPKEDAKQNVVGSNNWYMRFILANNQTTPLTVIMLLLEHDHEYSTLRAIARNSGAMKHRAVVERLLLFPKIYDDVIDWLVRSKLHGCEGSTKTI